MDHGLLLLGFVVSIREDALIFHLEVAAAERIAHAYLQARRLLLVIVETGASRHHLVLVERS